MVVLMSTAVIAVSLHLFRFGSYCSGIDFERIAAVAAGSAGADADADAALADLYRSVVVHFRISSTPLSTHLLADCALSYG